MQAAGHPFILGTECDILSVDHCESTLMRKALAVAACRCAHGSAAAL